MTTKIRKTDARQGERRTDQERILVWSVLAAVLSLGGVALAVIAMGSLGA